MKITLTAEQIDYLIRRIEAILELKKRNNKSNKPLGFGKKG